MCLQHHWTMIEFPFCFFIHVFSSVFCACVCVWWSNRGGKTPDPLLVYPVERDGIIKYQNKKRKGGRSISHYLMPGMETTGCRLASSQVNDSPSVVALSPLSATSPPPLASCWWIGLLLAVGCCSGARRLLVTSSTVQSQSTLTDEELLNSTIRIPAMPMLSDLCHPHELLNSNATSYRTREE